MPPPSPPFVLLSALLLLLLPSPCCSWDISNGGCPCAQPCPGEDAFCTLHTDAGSPDCLTAAVSPNATHPLKRCSPLQATVNNTLLSDAPGALRTCVVLSPAPPRDALALFPPEATLRISVCALTPSGACMLTYVSEAPLAAALAQQVNTTTRCALLAYANIPLAALPVGPGQLRLRVNTTLGIESGFRTAFVQQSMTTPSAWYFGTFASPVINECGQCVASHITFPPLPVLLRAAYTPYADVSQLYAAVFVLVPAPRHAVPVQLTLNITTLNTTASARAPPVVRVSTAPVSMPLMTGRSEEVQGSIGACNASTRITACTIPLPQSASSTTLRLLVPAFALSHLLVQMTAEYTTSVLPTAAVELRVGEARMYAFRTLPGDVFDVSLLVTSASLQMRLEVLSDDTSVTATTACVADARPTSVAVSCSNVSAAAMPRDSRRVVLSCIASASRCSGTLQVAKVRDTMVSDCTSNLGYAPMDSVLPCTAMCAPTYPTNDFTCPVPFLAPGLGQALFSCSYTITAFNASHMSCVAPCTFTRPGGACTQRTVRGPLQVSLTQSRTVLAYGSVTSQPCLSSCGINTNVMPDVATCTIASDVAFPLSCPARPAFSRQLCMCNFCRTVHRCWDTCSYRMSPPTAKPMPIPRAVQLTSMPIRFIAVSSATVTGVLNVANLLFDVHDAPMLIAFTGADETTSLTITPFAEQPDCTFVFTVASRSVSIRVDRTSWTMKGSWRATCYVTVVVPACIILRDVDNRATWSLTQGIEGQKCLDTGRVLAVDAGNYNQWPRVTQLQVPIVTSGRRAQVAAPLTDVTDPLSATASGARLPEDIPTTISSCLTPVHFLRVDQSSPAPWVRGTSLEYVVLATSSSSVTCNVPAYLSRAAFCVHLAMRATSGVTLTAAAAGFPDCVWSANVFEPLINNASDASQCLPLPQRNTSVLTWAMANGCPAPRSVAVQPGSIIPTWAIAAVVAASVILGATLLLVMQLFRCRRAPAPALERKTGLWQRAQASAEINPVFRRAPPVHSAVNWAASAAPARQQHTNSMRGATVGTTPAAAVVQEEISR